jgi:hypothetical protein
VDGHRLDAYPRESLLWALAAVFTGAAEGDWVRLTCRRDQTEGWIVAIKDDFFGSAYIDIDEWREEPIRFRYVHGGFEGTDTRFSFYFPPPEQYEGRFLHFLEGGPGGNEATALGAMSFVASIEHASRCGAYLVESNQGHLGMDLSGVNGDSSILCWRASAESARFSKQLAAEMYGEAPHHGYLFGGSGGGIRSLNGLEQVDDVWDAGIPFVHPHQSTGAFFAMLLDAMRILQPVLPRIADAVDIGGSGKPFEGLTISQADALATLYKTGFPRGIGLDQSFEAVLVYTWFTELFNRYDPTYYDDFWSRPGYLGHDDPGRFDDVLIEIETEVSRVVTAQEVMTYPADGAADKYGVGDVARMIGALTGTAEMRSGITVAGGDVSSMGGAAITILTGAAAGRELNLIGVLGDLLIGSAVGEAGNLLFVGVQPGDRVRISNRKYLAYCNYYRHQVQAEYPEWAHLVVDGEPIYEQRPIIEKLWAHDYTYDIGNKKMFLIQNMLDRGCFPGSVIRYQERLREKLGGKLDEQLRVWFIDHAQHAPATMLALMGHPEVHSQLIDYEGFIQQAIKDLIDWVEYGKEPLPSTACTYTEDSCVVLPSTAVARGGIQPVVNARANGAVVTEVKTGDPVVIEADIEVPPGAGLLTRVEWDPEGNGTYPITEPSVGGTKAEVRLTHTFTTPGTYKPAVRVTAHRDGDATDDLFQLRGLGRCRVIVR